MSKKYHLLELAEPSENAIKKLEEAIQNTLTFNYYQLSEKFGRPAILLRQNYKTIGVIKLANKEWLSLLKEFLNNQCSLYRIKQEEEFEAIQEPYLDLEQDFFNSLVLNLENHFELKQLILDRQEKLNAIN